MQLTPQIKRQLRIFTVIAVVSLALALFDYARVLAIAGIGVYDVQVDFRDASGLYANAQVTHHGIEVGKVASLRIQGDDAVATLRIDDDFHIPANATAALHSTSAIGEQYVDLVTQGGGGPYLKDGSVIPRDRTIEMPQITPVLNSVNRLLASVPRSQTRRVLGQVGAGLGGSGQDLGHLVDASGRLLAEAQAHIDATTSLVAALKPVLDTQRDLGLRTRSYAAALDKLSATVASDHASDLRGLLTSAPALDAMTRTVGGLRPVLPMMLYNLTTGAQVLHTYLPQLRQTLVVYPAALARLQGMTNPGGAGGYAGIDIRSAFNQPPSCSSGYLAPDRRRSPSDTSSRAVNLLAHCEVPAADPRAVRGARNLPCPNSSRRGALPADCGITFRGGRWPASSKKVAYDLAVGRAPAGSHQLAAGSSTEEDEWKILVLAPLAAR